MDLGEPFKLGMRIDPSEEGTFVVEVNRRYEGPGLIAQGPRFGFTTIDDLLIWMAKHGARSRATELTDDEIVNRRTARQGLVGGALVGMDAINGLRRTTAAEIIREREAKAFANGDVVDYNITPTPAA